MKVLELSVCPACGGQEFRGFDLGGGNYLRRCLACDTVSAAQYADPSEIYVDGYMFGQGGRFGLDVRDELFQRYLLRVAGRRIAMIERATGGKPRSLLDIGSGTGEVLLTAQERGWRVQGVEPERTAAAMARERGLPVEVAMLEDSGLPERSYDVVSAFHVLEHVPDSRSFLRTLMRWVRPGGHLVIEVPNFDSVLRRRFGPDWVHLRPLEHLVHFTPRTLTRTLQAQGLQPVSVRTPAYVGPPQTLEQATWDLARPGRYRSALKPISRGQNGTHHPGSAAWAILRATEALYDRAGVGTVVFCVASVP